MSPKETKEPFTIRPPASIMDAVQVLTEEDGIATERAMGAYCLRTGVALHALASASRAGLSEEAIESILMPFAVPLTRFLIAHGLITMGTSVTAPATQPLVTEAPPPVASQEDIASMSQAADDLDTFMDS